MHHHTSVRLALLLLCLLFWTGLAAQQAPLPTQQQGYQRPPEPIAQMVEAPNTPAVLIDQRGEWLLLLEQPGFPSIEEVAAPELRLGGLRINPRNNGGSRNSFYSGISLRKMVDDGKAYPLQNLPAELRISNVRWSPDFSRVAFTNYGADDIELWVLDINSRTASRLATGLNDAYYGAPYQWQPDGQGLLVKTIPKNRGPRPDERQTPGGPVIQQNIGGEKPSRTYQDLLQNSQDEALFDYYLSAQLQRIDLQGAATPLGKPALFKSFQLAPDGQHLLVEQILRPYSYLVPSYYFPYSVEVWNQQGGLVKQIAQLPLAEDIPIAFDAVPRGPRSFSWHPAQPATLYWAEAQDQGNPAQEVEHRDFVYLQKAPFSEQPVLLAKTQYRYRGADWSEDNQLAIVYERWWKTRRERWLQVNPAKPQASPKVLRDQNYEDLYKDMGDLVTYSTPRGQRVLLRQGGDLFLISEGYSPEGNRPYLSRFTLASGANTILWRSEAPYYERPVDVLNLQPLRLLTRRESLQDPPNYFLHQAKSRRGQLVRQQVTNFPHPTPQLKGVKKELVEYSRADGVKLTATLYLPEGYDPSSGERLPVLIWAYPREYKSADAAAQVRRSPYQFTRVSWGSPIYFVTQGYAILDGAEMPIVGEGDKQPNDSFVEQLRMNAEAAISKLESMGVGDPKRVAVGGHSYGAFMTANLLTHTNLFAAGIARSGAYNRTLTPFGFQAEERTYWQAPDIYNTMSPFMHAHSMKTPLLLIHGEADNNSGTFPIQSERYYNALKGHGATTRLVMLPAESHGYRARESVLHMLWETSQWLDKYVKNRPQEDEGTR
ncbi:S9 family peptidase [Cesiribacter andamanensis]|uniref:Poly(3-hydroxybutyrate) depolymerase n=1 Tax=Cesiribacter andamanensis AMV16 TaxID=1279009 RepID=M7NRA1_9BACT|nr:prolyl oligopeptidase family serine peptidase [Cesiribacter andamanensis]EMR01049.1 Poly(3-hydroxybutyrate) depolymerase [Cesiribacter andamanensis AMV16]